MAERIDLRDDWTMRAVGAPPAAAPATEAGIPAAVPGCVHTDLLAAGLIPDPYLDANETALAWIGRTEWRYSRPLDVSGLVGPNGHERLDLVCEGLDTVAEIAVDGRTVGSTANMHRGYRFDLLPALRPGAGPAALEITFGSAYRYAEELRERLGDRPCSYPEPFNFIRKMACNFGWDWGPTLVTAGIWRPIWLHAWSTARLARVRPLVTVRTGPDGRRIGEAAVHVDIERSGPGREAELILRAAVAGRDVEVTVPAGATEATAVVEVPDPALWWPRGYGEAALYPLELVLAGPDGAELDSWRRRVGFRTVELDTSADDTGTAFTFVVNGRPVLVKGANWIPDDCFPSRVDAARYAQRLDQAVDANLNLLRIWGGGIYESDDFYRLCDERGLMVWQDFLFACAAYPEEEPLAAEVEAEARDAVVRLAPHPSLVLWNGNNENIWGYADWDWVEPLAGRSWGEGYYLDLLPRVVAELDPTRPYWPGSPYSGRPEVHPNDPAHGPMHIWDVWNRRDYTAYLEYRPRFVAEFGFQAPPAYATLRRAVSDRPLRPDSPGLLHHQKAVDGNGKLERGLAPHFAEPADFDDWHYLTQLNQARAIALGVEHFRAQQPTCMGTVVWQINDCWPVTSWAMVDGDARRKPLWYALRAAYRPRLVTLQPAAGGGLTAVLANDTDEAWDTTAVVARRDLSGRVLARAELPVRVPPRAVAHAVLPERVARPDVPQAELVTADADELRGHRFFTEDADIEYPAALFEAKVAAVPEGWLVTVTAQTLLRDLAIFADRLDPGAEVDDMLVTLLPGETHRFLVRGTAALDPAALVRPPVLRCVNDTVRRPRTPAA
ncbi:glycosyl hydrolase 2 galactose-binding domain-containing protein [Allonocardiopsis opalescens]|uniref:beta-mannosidase n=1 Tax=Allonocardiopsis opalescens TaxID=1144618 RepID=A0A2T0Q016_9ACTN|nr:glycoside hydrolase family 2 protein [Allonocardiopsis opalescens]PRX97045.1 beta-mannosidase [Allonocardiopsis opalescens]